MDTTDACTTRPSPSGAAKTLLGDAVCFELTYYGGMPDYGYFPWRGPSL